MKLIPITASTFLADGGAMFGLVPKPIWSKMIEPNERNAIAQNANVLLVELNDGRRGLIDTGCGSADLFSAKEQRIHGLGPGWPLVGGLTAQGVLPEQIDFVVLTHLHWDHAGGLIQRLGDLGSVPAFPEAEIIVHEQEWEDAASGNPLFYKAYPPAIVENLKHRGAHVRKVSDGEILPGLRLLRSGGHTRGHSVVVLEDEALQIQHPDADGLNITKVVYAADVCPTRHHLRMVFQAAYDMHPLDTRAWKREWLPQIADENMLLWFDHDPDVCAATLVPDDRAEFVVKHALAAPR